MKETPQKEAVDMTNHTVAVNNGHSHRGSNSHGLNGHPADKNHGNSMVDGGTAPVTVGTDLAGTSRHITIIHLRDSKEQISIKHQAAAVMLAMRRLPFRTKHGLPIHPNTCQEVHPSHLLLKHRV